MLAKLSEVVALAKAKSGAIGSLNTPNLETLIAVLDGAEALNVPVIIAHAQLHDSIAPLDKIGPVMIELAKRSKVKVCVHLDHGEDFEYCKRAIDMGFTSVMIDYSTLPYEENIKGTKEVVEYAHSKGVEVEAELGALPQREGGGESQVVNASDLYTKPELVPDFVSRTGIDALAIAFGTAHGIYKSKPVLNMDVISKVKEVTNLPLVMHGGSGISHEEYKEVIRRGIGKINYYTYMAFAGYESAKRTVEEKPEDFFHVLALNAQKTMQKDVEKTLKIFSNLD